MPAPPTVVNDPYLIHRSAIERTIDGVCRRHRLAAADAEDFASIVRIRLIDNDYAVLRAFQGRSKIETYLGVVILRLLQDWRNARWGKWRPSAEARRLGPLAVQLETLLVRDQRPFDEAVRYLHETVGITEPREVLEQLAARFKVRQKRREVGDTVLQHLPAADGAADEPMARDAAAETARRISAVLVEAINGLDPEDRLVLRLHFEDGRTIADVARSLSLDQKNLYRRLSRIFAELRGALESAGLTADAAAEALEHRGFDQDTLAEPEEKGHSASVFSFGARQEAIRGRMRPE